MKKFSDEINFRVAIETDVPGIRRVIRSAVEGIAAKEYPPEVIVSWGLDNEKTRIKQQELIRNDEELTWVACRGEAIVGFSAFSPKTEELRAVYIAVEVARMGVGSKLLELVETKAKELGLSKLTMHSSLTAAPFYERHGYSHEGEIIHTLATGVKMKAVAMQKQFK